jgi:hypothetical protein
MAGPPGIKPSVPVSKKAAFPSKICCIFLRPSDETEIQDTRSYSWISIETEKDP